MRRACFLLISSAIVCVAQNQGFVNNHLLRADFLHKSSRKAALAPLKFEKPCIRIAPVERVRTPKRVDPKMVLPLEKHRFDLKMAIEPQPACPDK